MTSPSNAYNPTRASPGASAAILKGLNVLFFTEMWERFSYYGMRAILVLFMVATRGAGWSWPEHGTKPAQYLRFLYYVASISRPFQAVLSPTDLIGPRNAVAYWRRRIIALGHFTMAFPTVITSFLRRYGRYRRWAQAYSSQTSARWWARLYAP